jgi:hypothetical protein
MSIADVGLPYYSECVQGESYAVLSLREIQRRGTNRETLFCLEVGRTESGGAYVASQLIVSDRNLFQIMNMIHRYGVSTIPPEQRSEGKADAEPTGDGPK